MRRFITTVFDSWVYSTSTYTADEHQALLGSVDQLAIQAIVNAVSGAALLTVAFQSSSDGIKWTEHSLPIDEAELLAQQNNVVVGVEAATTAMGRARLRVVLTGASPQARVRLIVCGRDRERTGEGGSVTDDVVMSRTRAGPQSESPERRAGTMPAAAQPHRGTKRLEDGTP